MGGGDEGEPLIGPTSGSGESDSADREEDSRQSGIEEHVPDDQPAKDDPPNDSESPSTTPPGGAGGGGTPAGAPVTPPSTEPPVPSPDEPVEEEEETDSTEPDTIEEKPTDEELDQPDDHDDRDDQEEQEEDDDDEDDEDEEDEEEQEPQIVVHSDAWDNIGVGLYPIRFQLQEEYGDQIQIDDQLVPVRNFDAPSEMAEKWERDAQRHDMPIDTSIWDTQPPKSTEKSNRAFNAARLQGHDLAKRYIRRLRLASTLGSRNIEDYETLVQIAREAGLDIDQFEEDLETVDVQESTLEVETPKTTIRVDGETITQRGYLHPDDIKMLLEQAGLEEGSPQPLDGFVDEYGPVTVRAVQQIYGLDRNEALARLQSEDAISSMQFGDVTLWESV